MFLSYSEAYDILLVARELHKKDIKVSLGSAIYEELKKSEKGVRAIEHFKGSCVDFTNIRNARFAQRTLLNTYVDWVFSERC